MSFEEQKKIVKKNFKLFYNFMKKIIPINKNGYFKIN